MSGINLYGIRSEVRKRSKCNFNFEPEFYLMNLEVYLWISKVRFRHTTTCCTAYNRAAVIRCNFSMPYSFFLTYSVIRARSSWRLWVIYRWRCLWKTDFSIEVLFDNLATGVSFVFVDSGTRVFAAALSPKLLVLCSMWGVYKCPRALLLGSLGAIAFTPYHKNMDASFLI